MLAHGIIQPTDYIPKHTYRCIQFKYTPPPTFKRNKTPQPHPTPGLIKWPQRNYTRYSLLMKVQFFSVQEMNGLIQGHPFVINWHVTPKPITTAICISEREGYGLGEFVAANQPNHCFLSRCFFRAITVQPKFLSLCSIWPLEFRLWHLLLWSSVGFPESAKPSGGFSGKWPVIMKISLLLKWEGRMLSLKATECLSL